MNGSNYVDKDMNDRINDAVLNAAASMRMEGFYVSDEDIENLAIDFKTNGISKIMEMKNG